MNPKGPAFAVLCLPGLIMQSFRGRKAIRAGVRGVGGLGRHMYAYMHIHIYIYIYTCIRTYIRTYIHTYIHTCMHAYIHTYIHTYIYTRNK